MLALVIIHIIIAIVLVITVLLQESKSAGLAGSIAGGAETFFGKSKSRMLEGILPKVTSIVAIMFLVTSLLILFLAK